MQLENKIYHKITPRYVVIYRPLMLSMGPVIISVYIDRKTKAVKKHISRIQAKDIDKFLSRIKPFQELNEGSDVVAKAILQNDQLREFFDVNFLQRNNDSYNSI